VCLAAGVLPFGSIFIETYFIFTSFWNYKVRGAGGLVRRIQVIPSPPPSPAFLQAAQFYYVYGFGFLCFLILAVVVSCCTIVAAYFQLNAEGAWG